MSQSAFVKKQSSIGKELALLLVFSGPNQPFSSGQKSEIYYCYFHQLKVACLLCLSCWPLMGFTKQFLHNQTNQLILPVNQCVDQLALQTMISIVNCELSLLSCEVTRWKSYEKIVIKCCSVVKKSVQLVLRKCLVRRRSYFVSYDIKV